MRFLTLVFLIGCGSDASVCEDLCQTLVLQCGYEAFPTLESCQQGCEYDASQGADVNARNACIQAASCDTFAVVECEHD